MLILTFILKCSFLFICSSSIDIQCAISCATFYMKTLLIVNHYLLPTYISIPLLLTLELTTVSKINRHTNKCTNLPAHSAPEYLHALLLHQAISHGA